MSEQGNTKIITAEHILPMEGPILSPGAMAIQGEKILSIGEPASVQAQFPKAEVLPFQNQTILPGLINAHTDLSLTNHPIESTSSHLETHGGPLLMEWLIKLSRYKSELTIPEQQKAVNAGLNYIQNTGVTTLGDRCRYPAAVPLYENSDLRIVCLAEIENIQRTLAQDDFEQALALVDEIQHSSNPKLSAGLAPFASYTLSKNLLRIIADHAIQQQIPLHLIAALSFSEMEFFYDSGGEISTLLFKEAGWEDKIPPPHHKTPIQYLNDIGFLQAKPTLIGCLHLGPTDAAILEQTQCQRLYAPSAFHALQLGELTWERSLIEPIAWTLGTLGKAWGGRLNLWDEMRTILNEAPEEERGLVGDRILQACTLQAAHALRLENQIGSLLPGKQADFIIVDTAEGDDSLAAGLIDQTQNENIRKIFIAGDEITRA